ncbi:MAG: N-acetylmuramoyl-L-alanine amidase [Thermoleophilia bacterium]
MRYSSHMPTSHPQIRPRVQRRSVASTRRWARVDRSGPPSTAARSGLFETVLFLAIIAGLFLAPATALAHPSTFADVAADDQGHEAIEYLAAAEVVGGYDDGTFRPSVVLNRGQAAKMLVRQNGLTVASKVTTRAFSDIEAVYGTYVEAAASKGWITGYPDRTFRTYDPLQRQHMAVIVVRSLGWEADAQKLTSAQVTQGLASISDVARISATARPYVALALQRGLFRGDTQGRFNPTDPITRAQFSLVAYRAELQDLAVVQGLRTSGDHPDKTRVVIDLSGPPGDVASDLSGSSVLVVDIAGAVVEAGGIDSVVGSKEVDLIAARQLAYRPQKVRVTLTLKRFARYVVSVIPPSDGRGYRVVIDVFRQTDTPGGDGPPLVALDAGHGGKDTGAVGITGLLEKAVNLAIVLRMDRLLRDAGLRTLLTRDSDTYPTLQERTDLANQARATIFVSVHNNAAGDPTSNGTETFYWGATGGDYSLEGRKLAEAIQKNLVADLASFDRGARTHWKDLHVLRESLMPSALAEVGFLTNAEEEAKLRDPAYLDAAAAAIVKGILEYLDQAGLASSALTAADSAPATDPPAPAG